MRRPVPSRAIAIPVLAALCALAGAASVAPAAADEMSWVPIRRASLGAPSAQLRECERVAGLHGTGSGRLSDICFEIFFELAPPVASKRSLDGEVTIAGFRNAVLAKVMRHDEAVAHLRGPQFSDNLVAGSSTQIHTVQALSLDTIARQVAVLDGSSHDILFFGAPYEGNIHPDQVIHDGSLKDALGIGIDAAAGEVDVVTPSSVIFLARDPKLGPVLRSISGSSTRLVGASAIAVDANHHEVFVTDRITSQLLVFSTGSRGNAAPVRVIGGSSTRIDRPQGVSYIPNNDVVQVINGDGSMVNFSRTSVGDTAPLK